MGLVISRVIYLETSWAPVNELDGSLGFDGGNGGVDVLGDNITTVQHAAGHVFTVSWIALDHLVGWFETSVGDFSNGELFVVCLNMIIRNMNIFRIRDGLTFSAEMTGA